MSPRILLHLLLITISLEVIAQDAQQIFYDSFLFCKYLDQLPENERANYSDQLLSEFPNDKFVEMDKNENLLFNDPAKEIDFDYSDSLQAFFHILTGYKYFDDSKYDQFEKRRLEQFQSTHNVVKAVTDQSIFKIVDEVKGSSLGLFDFDRSCFTLDISSSTDTYSKLNNHSDQKEKPNNYESNSYKLELAPINNPDLIRIVIDDEDKAQQFSHSTMKVSYIFTLTGHVEEYKSFQDIASTGMNYYEAQIYRLGSIGGDWAQWNAWQRLNTQKRIKIFNKYCQTNGMPGLPPYGRRYYHRMETQLMAVILESKIIGNYFWKAPKWSKVIAMKAERRKNEELLKAERLKNKELLKAERIKKEELLKAERIKKEELLKADQAINIGDSLSQNGEYDQAFASYKRALLNGPNNWRIHYKIGDLSYKTGDYKESLINYQKALSFEPYKTSIHSAIGRSYYRLENFKLAESSYNNALEIDSTEMNSLIGAGYNYMATRDYEHALIKFKKALNVNPENRSALLGQGDAYYWLGMYDKAIDSNERILRINPEDVIALSNLGDFYYKTRNLEKVVENLTKAFNLESPVPLSYSKLAMAYYQQKQYRGAFKNYQLFYQEADSVLYKDLFTINNKYYAISCLRTGNYSEAIVYLKKRVPKDEEEKVQILLDLGWCHKRLYETSTAIDYFFEVLDIEPENKRATYNLGECFFDNEEYERAIIKFNRAFELGADPLQIYLSLANSYKETDEFKLEILNFQKAARLGDKIAQNTLKGYNKSW